jgi:hypothetical protein
MSMTWRHALITATSVMLAFGAQAADRSKAVRAEFQRSNPCPSTGATRGKCPGYQADHRIAICAGGADRAGNLQWLSIDAHKRKTRQDIMECRSSGR